jgi:hypothetical protein
MDRRILLILAALMLPASADAHCGNNKCLWHGHHHYYRHVRLEPQDSIKEWQAQWRAAKTKPIRQVMPLPLYPPPGPKGTEGFAPAPIPGWDDLILCRDLVSLERSKALSLRKDHSVISEDLGPVESNGTNNRVTIKGTWSYDGNSKEYTLTLGGMTAIYTVVQPKDSSVCLFIKGKLEAADLHESWVSADSDYAPEEQPTTP